ncbi:Hypothetical predicted protein, partial [Pelobates cultripes]
DQIEALSRPLTLTEVEDAIRDLPGGKSPEADGLSNLYYKKYASTLAPHLLETFHQAMERGTLPTEMLLATIVTLPKPAKPTDSYKN